MLAPCFLWGAGVHKEYNHVGIVLVAHSVPKAEVLFSQFQGKAEWNIQMEELPKNKNKIEFANNLLENWLGKSTGLLVTERTKMLSWKRDGNVYTIFVLPVAYKSINDLFANVHAKTSGMAEIKKVNDLVWGSRDATFFYDEREFPQKKILVYDRTQALLNNKWDEIEKTLKEKSNSLETIYPPEKVHVIPIAVFQNQYRVLVVRSQNFTWWQGFSEKILPKDSPATKAENLLKNETNNQYDFSDKKFFLKKLPNEKNPQDFYYVVAVGYVSTETFLKKTQKGTEFAWVSVEEVWQGQFNYKGKTSTIALYLKDFFSNYWNKELLPKVNNWFGIEPKQPVQKQTSDSVGKNNLAPWLSSINTGQQAFDNKAGSNDRNRITELTLWPKADYIYFYHYNQPYYEFSNYKAGYPFKLRGYVTIASFKKVVPWITDAFLDIQWLTSEQAFQALKSNKPVIWQQIANLSGPDGARRFWSEKDDTQKAAVGYVGQKWHDVKTVVMRNVLRAKFGTYKQLKDLLIGTDNKILVENTFLAKYDDSDWGNGLNDTGKNLLGRILMQIRAELMVPPVIEKRDNFPYMGPVGQVTPSQPAVQQPSLPLAPGDPLKNLESNLNTLEQSIKGLSAAILVK